MESLNKLERVVLFLNASSYKYAVSGSAKDPRYEGRFQGTGAAINYLIEFALFNILGFKTNNLSHITFALLLASPLIFHLIIDLIFAKDLTAIAENYYYYYGKAYYIIYCILAALSFIYVLYYYFVLKIV